MIIDDRGPKHIGIILDGNRRWAKARGLAPTEGHKAGAEAVKRIAKNENGEWEKVPYYTVDDTIPYGHGEKSVMMLTEYIKLTSEEKYCIRWHMGFTEPKELYNTIGAAFKKYPLALLLHEADLEATYFYDI